MRVCLKSPAGGSRDGGQRVQAGWGLRRRIAAPTTPKPLIMSAQLAGSGMGVVAAKSSMLAKPLPMLVVSERLVAVAARKDPPPPPLPLPPLAVRE